MPLNYLHQVKSRLAGLDVDRAHLALGMLRHVAEAVKGAGVAVRVVSPDSVVDQTAREWGLESCLVAVDGLNPGLEAARRQALSEGFQRVLVVLPDLPYLRSQDIQDLLERQEGKSHSLWLAPDRWGRGTNLWLSQPVEGLPFLFGQESLQAHRRAAAQSGWECNVFQSEGSQKDLDTPEDWEEFRWTLPSNCFR